MAPSHRPWPLHRKLTAIGWTCLALFALILITDEITKWLGLPRLEQWPGIGWVVWITALPLLVGGVLCLIPVPILRRYHLRTHSPHLCVHCDYDRRGLDPGAPCPECGNPATPLPPPGA